MKKHILLSLLFSFILFSIASKSYAETYHGDFCWQVLRNEAPAWIYKLGVYQKEGGHYALYGSEDNGVEGITAAHGNATVVDSNIKLTMVGSGHTEQFGTWNETFSAVLNISTLNGTWHSLGIIDNTGTPILYHTNGNINLITCP